MLVWLLVMVVVVGWPPNQGMLLIAHVGKAMRGSEATRVHRRGPGGGGGATATRPDATPRQPCLKTCGGGGGSWGCEGGGVAGGWGGGSGSLAVGQGGAHNQLLSHAYVKRVSRGMGVSRYVCPNSDILSLPGRKS